MRQESKDGSVNETMILTALNNHKYIDLDNHWKKHIKRMFKHIRDEDVIKATYYPCKDAKPDLIVTVNNRSTYLSIKSGHSPSMHYEPLKTFYDFLREQGVSERIIKIISFYHYGYSLKPGVTPYKLTRDEIIEKYSKEIKEANEYFLSHQEIVREIIYRSIIRGRMKRDLIDYLYYGNSSKGYLLSISDIMRLIFKDRNEICPSIHFYGLTYVSCARSSSEKQHHLRINWPLLCKYFYDEEFMKKYG